VTSLPDLCLQVYQGDIKNLKVPTDLKNSLLFFYPKDDTPGCTKQSCEFTAKLSDFENLNIKVYGVSGDSIESHQAFSQKYKLSVPLIYDEDFKLSKYLGIYGDQEVNGFKYHGISRDIIFIDNEGKIALHLEKVAPIEGVKEAYSAVKEYLK
jgi:peroxiredoxin Q/BCP